jgi:hypothetical protein
MTNTYFIELDKTDILAKGKTGNIVNSLPLTQVFDPKLTVV